MSSMKKLIIAASIIVTLAAIDTAWSIATSSRPSADAGGTSAGGAIPIRVAPVW
jgi:hypothetical protein